MSVAVGSGLPAWDCRWIVDGVDTPAQRPYLSATARGVVHAARQRRRGNRHTGCGPVPHSETGRTRPSDQDCPGRSSCALTRHPGQYESAGPPPADAHGARRRVCGAGAHGFMMLVGVIEMVAGIGVLFTPWTKVFAWIVGIWLIGI